FKVLVVNLRHVDYKGRHTEAHHLRFRGGVFEGVLAVKDSGLFLNALRQGVGPGKAYGFGLLSLAPRARG
ncbi:hypothetical protein HKBW3S09_01900, partial [Candidatus Hakubella thermalkaliphila]